MLLNYNKLLGSQVLVKITILKYDLIVIVLVCSVEKFYTKFRRTTAINLLKPSGNFTYRQVQHSRILHGAHIAFMCFLCISHHTATFTLYLIN
jgi:hypothetical protein